MYELLPITQITGYHCPGAETAGAYGEALKTVRKQGDYF